MIKKKYDVKVKTVDTDNRHGNAVYRIEADSKMDARNKVEQHVRYSYPHPQHSAKPFYLYVQTEAKEAKTKKMRRL